MSDIIIIGGGVAGLSAAARLAEHANVTVLEGESAIGYHASGRSAALFEENYGCASVNALSRASGNYHRTANGGYLSPRGFLLLGRAGEDTEFETDLKELNSVEVSVKEARRRVPILNDTITRAAYHDSALDIDTDRLLQDFAKQVRHGGGRVITNARVEAISHMTGGWAVQANGETYRCDTLINAAGAWADQVAVMAGITPIGITPMRRSMARVPAPDNLDVSSWPIFFGVGETWYAKPDAGKLLISPADEDPTTPHDAYADDMVLAEGIDRYQQHVTPEITRVETTWAGLRSFAPDRTLVLGRDPVQPDFVWCAGQGGYGFQTAPAAGQLICDIVSGHPSELDPSTIAALSPDRFHT